jgi:hypothetical protein
VRSAATSSAFPAAGEIVSLVSHLLLRQQTPGGSADASEHPGDYSETMLLSEVRIAGA